MQNLKLKHKILYTFLVLSVGVNILVLFIDTFPFLYHRVEQKGSNRGNIKPSIDKSNIEQLIVARGLEMVKSKNVTMVWDDPSGFTKTIASKISKGGRNDFKTFNYPRAFLYYGLAKYFNSINNKDRLAELKDSFEDLIGSDGRPTFVLDKVDQVPFGNTAMILYANYIDEKYKLFYEYLYEYLKANRNDEGIILYRKDASSQLNDVLGMIVPFLVDYYRLTNDSVALEMAKDQIDFFIEYGVDQKTSIPSHGISLRHLTKVGSANWGRGIGWYLLALSALNNVTEDYKDEMEAIYRSLSSLKLNNNLYSQYPGSSTKFDASSSALFLYSFNCIPEYRIDKQIILDLFAPYVMKDGSITGTSGDTYGLNNYSQSFGKSELTQGILLLLLAN